LSDHPFSGAYRPGPNPPFPPSRLITGVRFDRARYHQAVGDMWPITWANDDHLYTAAGDNRGSPMNVWRVSGAPDPAKANHASTYGDWILDLLHNRPVDPAIYANHPRVNHEHGIKPAGLISLGSRLILAVEAQNFGDDPSFNRQTNVHGWFIVSEDFGHTWDVEATPRDFFTGRVASCHLVQYGRGDANVVGGYVHASFPGASDNGASYWENGDYVLLGRAPAERLLDRAAWEFWTSSDANGPRWSRDEAEAAPVFRFDKMTGENHMSYSAPLQRYLMGNYAFLDPQGEPRPYHQLPWPQSIDRSQLTLFEAPELWGPWSLFHRDDAWGTYGDYQPVFPVKWMFNNGRTLYMVSSGSFDDYNFVVQRLDLTLADGA
jgi:hypothetical protein